MGSLAMLNEKGDVRTMWDPEVPAEVEAARKQFNRLRKDGYLAYVAEGDDGHRGRVIHEFEPGAKAIIMAPQLVGG